MESAEINSPLDNVLRDRMEEWDTDRTDVRADILGLFNLCHLCPIQSRFTGPRPGGELISALAAISVVKLHLRIT